MALSGQDSVLQAPVSPGSAPRQHRQRLPPHPGSPQHALPIEGMEMPCCAALPPPTQPPILGSGKVAKCHWGHWSNKSSSFQHLQAPKASPLPMMISPPTPCFLSCPSLTKHLLSQPEWRRVLFPLQRPSEAKLWAAREDAYVSAGSLYLTLFLCSSYFFSLTGVTQSLSLWLHIHIKTSRKRKTTPERIIRHGCQMLYGGGGGWCRGKEQ